MCHFVESLSSILKRNALCAIEATQHMYPSPYATVVRCTAQLPTGLIATEFVVLQQLYEYCVATLCNGSEAEFLGVAQHLKMRNPVAWSMYSEMFLNTRNSAQWRAATRSNT